ncbi:hypothetical protein VD0002_g1591 [Verticillium dahliae]|uniref:Uncharacterized protein n=1 Tax=Verticillium dahliae TaxID=27337 RepID=A0A2J8FQE2_VERDA|nr:hypothetical protein VdG2_05616 [Verticillium dahliae VDG2]KAF3360493.1 Presequence translocase-associated motor [Verticillium dahliae VDG1]KAH6700400.1 hypothetical protein EV126DRAFT_34643 [Verticillium dahliae]PNH34484.1 hypothetical protein BJF96_g2128 [Verticillium dahliae]PNH46374.1 hypothetical protein VD0004_g1726 [Verticillium dahliae]
MAQRPTLLDLRSKSSSSNMTSASKPLRSPRLHVAGEIPPELSPLDAFALQSRLLARQLKESDNAGRRMSRLPPLTTESPLVMQGRSDYFRSMSQDGMSEASQSPEPLDRGLGLMPEVEENLQRPMSMHPRMSRIPPTPDDGIPLPPQPMLDQTRGRTLNHIREDSTNFGARREESPTPMESAQLDEPSSSVVPSPRKDTAASLPMPSSSNSLVASPEKMPKKHSFDGPGLAPPRPMFVKRPSASSTMSSPLVPTDEDGVMSSSFHSLPHRKLSSGSAMSSMAAVSPAVTSSHYQRSPSISSDISVALPRPSFNFSRPLSRAGTPGPETPSRQASSDTQASFVLADDTANTPISMNSEGFPDTLTDDGKSAATSYIYSKYTLPRGKSVQRSLPLESQPLASLRWEQSTTRSDNGQSTLRGAPPSPPTRPSSSSERMVPDHTSLAKQSFEQGKRSMERNALGLQPSPNPSRPSTESSRASEDETRGRPLTSPLHDSARLKTAVSIATSDSASTVKPAKSLHSIAPSAADMTAEEHLAKGIECHENGSVNESTYHLRHAAKQNHPTGMLLYALACRHGWGMRPNQREGVEWLRKASELVSNEIADDEGQVKQGKHVDVLDRKTRKAQFALAVYELGVSHMNGWGIEQDKVLALRCFEIAGSWGDLDALAEAGYCYAQGVGCKKDLKKAAKFYREAESKGMSMVGNSWIHKSKYNDDSKELKKVRSKSRTRNIFGIKTGGS